MAMKIAQSSIAMQSQHASVSLRTSHTAMRAWVGNQRPDFEGQRPVQQDAGAVRLTLSQAASKRWQSQAPATSNAATAKADAVAQADAAVRNDPRLAMLIDMVESITGRRIRVFDARELQSGASNADLPVQLGASGSQAGAAALPAAPAGWGLELDSRQTIAESEATQVSAQGVVQTADGRQINFTLELAMSRSFVQESSTSIRSGDAVRKDPLVINFGGAGVALTDTQFAFDLNADGQQENIAFVAGGSGFLALDKNGDGKINDGSELFGPRSGDGFADLAKYDHDGNQWIDDNDAVFSQLRVWQRDVSGQDSLTSLAQSGVGALYLGRVASPFSVDTASNQSLGLVRSTGVFLYESGQAGSLQQVDL